MCAGVRAWQARQDLSLGTLGELTSAVQLLHSLVAHGEHHTAIVCDRARLKRLFTADPKL